MTVSVLLNLPDDVYRALLPKALKNGTHVHKLIENVVTRSVRGVPKPRVRRGPEPLTPEQRTQRRLDRQAAFAAAPEDPRHGSHNGYANLGCRCDRCRAANSAYEATRKNR